MTDDTKNPGHELREANATGILITGISTAVFVAVTLVVMSGWLSHLKDSFERVETGRVEPGLVQLRTAPPPPLLQVDSHADLEKYLNAENKRLNSYGWVNRGQGMVHIPIDRAIELEVGGAR